MMTNTFRNFFNFLSFEKPFFSFFTFFIGLLFSISKTFLVYFFLTLTLALTSVYYFYKINFYFSFDNIDLIVYSATQHSLVNNKLFYIDTTNIWFILLTNLLAPFVFLISYQSVKLSKSFYYSLLFSIFVILNLLFSCNNLLLFYVLFESLAIPMFLLIGLYGSNSTKLVAAYKFFIYSLFGSVTLLPSLIWLFVTYGTLNINLLIHLANFTVIQEIILFLGFFIPFAIKIPIIPFHLWLPEAHVEAPTPVSVLLAGLLLKTGGFALYKFAIPLFPVGAFFCRDFIFVLALVSIVYSSLYAVVQTDIKKMIAYASVGHMNFVTLGLINSDILGVQGALYLMITHGFISSGLFAGVGVLYDRYHTRIVRSYSGLVLTMPIFTILFFVLILGNVAFPFTGGFIAEFSVLVSTIKNNLFIGLLAGLSVFFCLVYSFWLFNRVFFGYSNFLLLYSDLKSTELVYLGFFVYMTVLTGTKSSVFFDSFSVYEVYTSPFYGEDHESAFSSLLAVLFL